jgi:hypothetical protein
LDKYAIQDARAAVKGCELNRLPIKKLVLSGFVVDAEPFFKWFNPNLLRTIEFKHDCLDAGFALPAFMEGRVEIFWPQEENPNGTETAIEGKVYQSKQLAAEEFKGGQPVKCWKGLSPAARYHLFMETKQVKQVEQVKLAQQAQQAKRAEAERKMKVNGGGPKGKVRSYEDSIDDDQQMMMENSESQVSPRPPSLRPSPPRRRRRPSFGFGFLYGGRRAIFHGLV